jgi:hypothetical protein
MPVLFRELAGLGEPDSEAHKVTQLDEEFPARQRTRQARKTWNLRRQGDSPRLHVVGIVADVECAARLQQPGEQNVPIEPVRVLQLDERWVGLTAS